MSKEERKSNNTRCAVCGVLCAVCGVRCAVCCVLCVVCCMLYAVYYCTLYAIANLLFPLLHITIPGWVRFWWQPNDFYGERKARFDFIITVTMVFALVVVMALKGTKNITVSLDLTSGRAPSIALFDEWPLRKDEVVDSDW